jgi:nucleotide-binding universal stress UspA family protein
MTLITNILVPVDFSRTSHRAMYYGTHLAVKYAAKLTAAHIVPSFAAFSYAFPADTQELERRALEDAKQRLPDQIPAAYREELKTEVIVRSGEVRKELIGIVKENDIDLVVMGTHGRQSVEKFFLGSVAEGMLRQVPVPILTVREGSEPESPFNPPFRRVLYATDMSEASSAGLHYCASLAHTLGARMSVLHVDEVRDTVAFSDNAEVRAGLMGRLHKLIEREPLGDAHIDVEVLRGTPHHEILKYAAASDADLIVINLQSKGLLERALLGSTAERVIRSAPIPVLSIPPGVRQSA